MKHRLEKDKDARVCPLAHRKDPDRPRRCAPGIGVCWSCADRVDRALRELPDMHADLAASHVAAGGGGPKITGTPEDPVPYRDRVGDCRTGITHGLADWARWTADERGVARPVPMVVLIAGEGPVCSSCGHGSCAALRPTVPVDDLDLVVVAEFLDRHRDWILAADRGPEFAEAMIAMSGQAHSILYPSGRRTFVITDENGFPATCTEVDDDGERCVGSLTAVLRDTDEYLPSAVVCGVCGVEVPAREWVTWARKHRKAA